MYLVINPIELIAYAAFSTEAEATDYTQNNSNTVVLPLTNGLLFELFTKHPTYQNNEFHIGPLQTLTTLPKATMLKPGIDE